ncbi:MAG: hypothetical protein GY934_20070, partial [Gammaproteobacteria bacterium]|nr:hypothetical protein [Gammaproteobacteria bacterium]
QGHPDPVSLFGEGVAVISTADAEGATLVTSNNGYELYLTGEGMYKITLHVDIPFQNEHHSKTVSFRIPKAVTNLLQLSLPEGVRVLGLQESVGEDDHYYFPPKELLSFRLEKDRTEERDAPPLVDSFSRINMRGGNYLITSIFSLPRGSVADLPIHLPKGHHFIATTLKGAWITPSGSDGVVVRLPREWQGSFSIDYEVPIASQEAATAIRLPWIPGNLGREGEFYITQPDDGDIRLVGGDYRQELPVSRLPSAIAKLLPGTARGYSKPLKEGEIQLELKRFDSVSAPDIVLDSVHFHTSFSDNGRAMSRLTLKLPPQVGNKLTLDAVPDAEIWSLKVNGKNQSLYSSSGGRWVVPLLAGGVSTVELAYLKKVSRLGLKGRLELTIPATGIAAHKLLLTVGLAERVEMISLEGDLVPVERSKQPAAAAKGNKIYNFSYPYYQGDSHSIALYYQEPVQSAPAD